MSQIRSVAQLRQEIAALEALGAEQKVKMIADFDLCYETYRPSNLIKGTLKELFGLSSLMDNFSKYAAGIAGAFIIQRYFFGKTAGSIKRISGTLIQYLLGKLLTADMGSIKSYGLSLISSLFDKTSSKR